MPENKKYKNFNLSRNYFWDWAFLKKSLPFEISKRQALTLTARLIQLRTLPTCFIFQLTLTFQLSKTEISAWKLIQKKQRRCFRHLNWPLSPANVIIWSITFKWSHFAQLRWHESSKRSARGCPSKKTSWLMFSSSDKCNKSCLCPDIIEQQTDGTNRKILLRPIN
jgi:hypothetical protein